MGSCSSCNIYIKQHYDDFSPDRDEWPTKKVDEVFDLFPFGWFHWVLVVVAGSIYMTDSIELNLIGFIADCSAIEWELSDGQVSLVTSIVFVGEIIGAIIFGSMADYSGYRPAILNAMVVMIVFGLISASSPYYWFLLASRCMVGIGLGCTKVSWNLLAEMTGTHTRAAVLILVQTFFSIGGMFVYAMAWAVMSADTSADYNWRYLIIVVTIPIIIAFIAAIYALPESPRWLLMQGAVEEAEGTVRYCAQISGLELENFQFSNPYKQPSSPMTPPLGALDREEVLSAVEATESTALVSPTQTPPRRPQGSKGPPNTPSNPALDMLDRDDYSISSRISQRAKKADYDVAVGSLYRYVDEVFGNSFKKFNILFEPEYKSMTLALTVTWAISGFTYFGFILLIDRLYDTSSGDDCTFDYSMLFINASAELVSIVVMFLGMDYMGRSTMHWWSFLATTIALTVMAAVPSSSSGVVFIAAYFGRMAINCIDTVNCIRTPEIYTTEVRTIAMSYLFFVSRITALISSYIVNDYSISTTSISIILAVTTAVSSIALLYIRETKDQDMDINI